MKNKLPKELKSFFEEAFQEVPSRQSALEFRRFVIEKLKRESRLSDIYHYFWNEDEVDALLYRHLPLGHRYQLKTRVEAALKALNLESLLEEAESMIDAVMQQDVFSAAGLRHLIETLVLSHLDCSFAREPWKEKIRAALQDLRFMMPRPLLFADTNWLVDWFGLTVNPGTGLFELWRLDPTGTTGFPMSSWRKWLNGSQKNPPWEIFNNPVDYEMAVEFRRVIR